MSLFPPPADIDTEVFARLPDALRRKGETPDWGAANHPGKELHSFLEGPSFDRAGNLYVVDIPYGRIFRISPSGDFTTVAEYDGWPNGLKIHKDGRLFIADHKHGILAIDPESGAVSDIVTHRLSESFKGVNDLVFDDAGNLYFTDQGQTGLHDPTGRVYRYNLDSGTLTCLVHTVPSPNGLVLNPEETILYVAVTRGNAVWRMPLRTGGVSKVGVFVQLSGGLGGPDGLAVDSAGNLCVTHAGMGSVWVFSRLGEPLYRVRSCDGIYTTNIAFGGPDNTSLFITESDTGSILRADMPVPGRPMYAHQA